MIFHKPPEDFNQKMEVVSCFIEYNGKILFLHRQNHKPQGDTWSVPAGKVEANEKISSAILREIKEEIGLTFTDEEITYLKKIYVRYPDFDFIYHMFHKKIENLPKINLNPCDHKDYIWALPKDAINMNLIQDEGSCLKLFYQV